jgi:cell division protein FtsI/penicillin-binding protein 2
MDIRQDTSTITVDQVIRSQERIKFVFFIWGILGCVIMARAFFIQGPKHNYFTDLGSKQYISSTPINFDRGTIFFSHFEKEPVPVAELKTTYSIAIDPTQISKPDDVYNRLHKYIELSKEDFINKAEKENDPYEEITRDIAADVALKIKQENIKGLMLYKNNKRSYTQDEVGAKLIGFVGNDGRKVKGQYGLERYYEDVLKRTSSEESVNFFAELFADIQKTTVSNINENEGDIILTIDSDVERMLHNTLVEVQGEWNSDMIGGIIMDPSTGAILAMETLPTYNPNEFYKVKDSSFFGNQNIAGVYEMGSIIKPLTMAAALDSQVITEKTTYNDTGFRDLNGYKVRNYDGKPRGQNTTMQTILDKSLNVGIVFLVEQLGIKRFQEYFKKFGLGVETGIDLPGEASGLTQNLDSNVLVDNATAGFGQGIAITPIQTIRALAALGNGGKLVTPHVVDSVIYENGERKKVAVDQAEQILLPETSERISRMLVHVVDHALKNGEYKMNHYSIAAKTGTAQMVKKGGGYYDDRYLHSFFGYFPAYDPKFIVFIFHTYPKGAEYASATLTDPFFKIVKFLISYYKIPPDR